MHQQSYRYLVGCSLLVLLVAGWMAMTPAETAPQVEAAAVAAPTPVQPVEITIDEVVASGFIHPVQVTHASDGSGRLFVVEQPGTIRIIQDGAPQDPPFLDITALTVDTGERGLLGLAFHPNYAQNGLFYVNYTRADNGATVIARYQVSIDPDVADPNSAFEILTIGQPYGNHNGGQLLFSPNDGYLYIGMGDGGSGGDPQENAQDPTNLLGAMLRIDVGGGSPYVSPSDNPYVGVTGRDEIWAIGLRNPWRFSFDRKNGDLYIGDVGQNLWEEISFQEGDSSGGLNFGWDCWEGTHQYEWTNCDGLTFTAPIAEYGHDVGRSITGGFVYRGTAYPALIGRYFYADYVTGRIWSLVKTGGGFTSPELELDTALNISAFGEDESGELYVVDRGGSVRRLADVNGPAPPPNLSGSSKVPSTPAANPGETVTYTITLVNTGRAVAGTVKMTDTIPTGLNYVANSLTATIGTPNDTGAPTLTWDGAVDGQTTITLTYHVTVSQGVTGSLVNYARLAGGDLTPLELPAALFVPRSLLPSTMQDYALPGTQPGTLNAEIPPSLDCDICHSSPIYDRWRGTMMSQSARDPLTRAALATANADAPSAGDYCLRCHAPKGWLEGRSHPADGSVLNAMDIANGVACEVCHRMVDPVDTGGETATIDAGVRAALTATVPTTYTGSATLIIDPNDNRRGPFAFDPALPYHTAYQTPFQGQASDTITDTITRSRLCGTCHDLDNPVLAWSDVEQQYWPNDMDTGPDLTGEKLFPIERTYSEWLNSDYPSGVVAPAFAGEKPDDVVAACQDCHMQRLTGLAADSQFNPVTRDCQDAGCLPQHMMVGGNTWMPALLQDPAWRLNASEDAAYLTTTIHEATTMLQKAATLSVTLDTGGPTPVATVRITNEAGHKLPTGYPEGRQMWLHLQAYDASGAMVYESGAYDEAEHRLGDTDAKVYEIKQGITPDLAALVERPAGASFHFVLNNTVIKDNRIPPRGYTQTAFDQDGLRPVGTTYEDGQHWDETTYTLPAGATRVAARLYYQTASREYVEFLRVNGGVDGAALYDLWTRSPSPPVMMAFAAAPRFDLYMPIIMKNGVQ